MMHFFNRNIAEILKSKSLIIYGGFLSLGHLFTFLFWVKDESVLKTLSTADGNPICWPYFFSCAQYRLPLPFLEAVSYIYVTLAIVAAALFFTKKFVKAGYFLLLFGLCLKAFFYIQSYRMMGNYHYMFFIISGLYLFVPYKQDLIRLMIVGFYLSAGTLKLNSEWLSGNAIYGNPLLKGELLEWACAYVVLLELLVSFFLLSSKRYLFYGALAQFFMFHLFSWHIVGFYYPCIMFCLLSLFWLSFKEKEFFVIKKQPAAVLIILGSFCFAQAAPYFYKGDTAITGEGRFWALNMFDVKSKCEFKAYARYENHVDDMSWQGEGLGVRVKCDPIIFVNYARNLCRALKADPEFKNIDMYLASKRTSEKFYKKIFQRQNVCNDHLGFNLLLSNPWIEYSGMPDELSQAQTWVPEHVRFVNSENLTTVNGRITSQYRESAVKSGISGAPMQSVQLKQIWEQLPFNVGVHSASKASPAVDDSGVYVGSDLGWFYAYNHDGSVKWKFYIGDAWRGIHGTAALDEDSVYLGTYDGILYSLNKNTGEIRWLHKLGIALGASPTLNGDEVIVNVELGSPPDGYLARLDRKTGKMLWHSQLIKEQGHSSPVVEAESELFYAGANNGRFIAYDMRSGAIKWEVIVYGPIKGTATVVNSQIIFTSWDGFLYSYDKKSGLLNWAQELKAKSQSSPTAVPKAGLVIYGVTDRGFLASDIKTGKIIWEIPVKNNSNRASAAVVFVTELKKWVAWLSCENKTLCAVDAIAGKILKKYPLTAHFTSVPVIHNNSVYVALDPPGGVVKLGL